MKVEVRVNDQEVIFEVEPQYSLLRALRQAGFFSVKRGCDTGDCGACAVLLDGKLVNSWVLALSVGDNSSRVGRRRVRAGNGDRRQSASRARRARTDIGIACRSPEGGGH